MEQLPIGLATQAIVPRVTRRLCAPATEPGSGRLFSQNVFVSDDRAQLRIQLTQSILVNNISALTNNIKFVNASAIINIIGLKNVDPRTNVKRNNYLVIIDNK